MKKTLWALAVTLLAASNLNSSNMKYSIIPEPVSVKESKGSFALNSSTKIVAKGADAAKSASFLAKYIKEYYGLELSVVESYKSKSNVIRLVISADASMKKEGAYKAEVGKSSVLLKASAPDGLFYSVQTLIQLLPPKPAYLNVKRAKEQAEREGNLFMTTPPFDAVYKIPAVKIFDYPRFEYRGMHLDVVRHIFPVDYIKKYIDYLALHKMNYFHWHLTDDQGWRIESRKYPLLNSVGSWRDGTIIGLFPGTGVDSTRYGGYYTQEQIRDIVQYAADRYITVVPEIDVPGHSMAIIASYPQFGTEPEVPKRPAITWGIYNRQNNVLAPSDEVFRFLDDVFNELMDLFPSKYIHIGADECSKMWWNRSPKVQQFLKDHNLKDGNALQHYFTVQIANTIKARGREFIGWDEMLDDGLVDGAVVMSWQDEKRGVEAAKLGHKAIMTPIHYHYFNVAQRDKEDSLCHNSWVSPVKKVYEFEPVGADIPESVEKYIIGGQGCLWTEYFPTISKVEWGIFPRMSAVAEIYWSPREVRNWKSFSERLIDQFDRYDLWGANYCTEFFETSGLQRR